jgi:ADP-ribose pyrophosphatase YjhB (NUDIX family)
LPIACVDAVLLDDSRGGAPRVGLIKRRTPFGDESLWCQIGGRVWRGETLAEALRRHIEASLVVELPVWPEDPQPDWVMQWFPAALREPGEHYGVDPRQHAIAPSFLLNVASEPVVRTDADSEAEEFSWFPADALPANLWPGTGLLIGHLLRSRESSVHGGTPRG